MPEAVLSAGRHRIRQIAYVVPDLRSAISRHAALFGSGPFFVAQHLRMEGHLYRGQRWQLDVDAALGQCGDVQIEFLQLNDDAPSIFREGAASQPRGPRCHHLCLHPDNLVVAITQLESAGYPVVFDYEMPGGTRAVFIDTLDTLGHFVELYERTPQVARIYHAIEDAAVGFDGNELIRSLGELLS